MGHRNTPSKVLVIDASIARSAGSTGAVDETSVVCRDILISVRAICHRMAWSSKIQEGWNKHRSGFALTWLVSMRSLGKLVLVDPDSCDVLTQMVSDALCNDGIKAAIQKDLHLVKCALETHSIVVSRDERIKRYLKQEMIQSRDVAEIMWLNPDSSRSIIEWLEAGAPV